MARRTFYFRDFICPDSHKTHKFVEAGTEWVMCEAAGCNMAAALPATMIGLTASVHGDEIDYVDHNLGKEPIRIRSKSQRRALMAAAGLVEFIRHTSLPGTDKSPYTTDWSKSIDPQTMENARTLLSRQGGVPHVPDDYIAPVANPISGLGNDAFNKLVKEYDDHARSSSRRS